MAVSLKQLGQMAEDMYYQDFATRDAFFDKSDFMFHAATYYSQAINQIYQAIRRENKAIDGFTNIELPGQWLIKSTISLSEDGEYFSASLPYALFSFDFDGFANGIQRVRDTGSKSKNKKIELIKITNNDIDFISLSPQTCVGYYWLSEGSKVTATKNVEMDVWYIPSVVGNDENCVLSDNIAADVIKSTLTVMFGAKNGNVVQMTNNGNNNPIIQNQTTPLGNNNTQTS